MKALVDVKPTPEQLALFSRIRPGIEIIRGAAGSGKTTTALLKLRAAVGFYVNRMKRASVKKPVRVLVLTFNRTLRGYVKELAEKQFEQGDDIVLEISTFSSWARALLNNPVMLDFNEIDQKLVAFSDELDLPSDFVVEEVAYVLGRFMPERINDYITARRDGRGGSPRMDRSLREALLSGVIAPYQEYKRRSGVKDWNDLAVELASKKLSAYDVVVVDEAQDFSANELRAVINQLADAHTATIVLDTTQRIYARSGFTWQEIGLVVRPENSFSLVKNYRNTQQIARFAAGILEGLAPDADGAMPNFQNAVKQGPTPVVLEGRFSSQLGYAIRFIKENVNLKEESVAFLHAKGGMWFSAVRAGLRASQLPFVEISRRDEWPDGDENIALSTMHSAKGLEFDHVIIIGLNGEVVPVEETDEVDHEPLVRLRRLVAMAVGRARKQIVIGYKPDDAPVVAQFFKAESCQKVNL